MRRLAQLALALGVALLALAALGAGLFQAFVLRDLPAFQSLRDYRPNLITRVYAADGELFAEFYRERREVIPIERIPRHLVEAVVAAEDDAFYEHEGLDYLSILRAAWRNLRAGGIRQGGSTITQQVAKTFLLSSERKWLRKLKEAVLAKRIEASFDKNEILFLYLNQIYLGSGAYGVEAAAQTYFAKPAEELSLAEAAMIAGLPPAPSAYSPFNSPERSRERQEFVLRQMVEEGYITEEEHQEALQEPLELAERKLAEARRMAAYFAEEVRRYLVERYGNEEVLTGGLTVQTTLGLADQQAAYQAVRAGLRAHDRRSGYRGPLRTVPEEDREVARVEIGEANGEPPWEDGDIVQALVLEVDDRAESVRLALGPERETQLTLEDVAWARRPDPDVDGLATKLTRMSRALRPGWVVELEKTGELEKTEQKEAEQEEGTGEGEGATTPTFTLYQAPEAEGALLAMDLEKGEVRALVGGYDFTRSEFNRVVQSRRQPGSAFKPIVYAAALEEGYTPASIVYDTPIVYEDLDTGVQWKPENYSEKFYGPITLREALARSRNIATIKVLREIGLGPVVRMARTLGIESPLENNLALGLGASEVTLNELVRAYAIFATGGRRVDPIFIREVRGRDGALLEQDVPLVARPESEEALPAEESARLDRVLERIRSLVDTENGSETGERDGALDPVTAYLMVDMLRAVVREGTGWRAKALRPPVGGKTGTTNDLHDAWFVGFSPATVCGVWVGYDVARTLGKNETGSRTASPIFVEFMRDALKRQRPSHFPVPEGVVFARIDPKTGLLAAPGGEKTVFQPFREGTAPTEMAPVTERAGVFRRPRLD